MSRRPRPSAARAAMAAALTAAFCTSVTPASAYVTTDLNDFNLTESVSFYGPSTQYHIASGTDGWVSYRWLDAPVKQTIIGAGACTDGSPIPTSQVISTGSTSYYNLFQGGDGQCFMVRGRTTTGQGSMSYYDGRIQR